MPHLPCSEGKIPEEHRDYRITEYNRITAERDPQGPLNPALKWKAHRGSFWTHNLGFISWATLSVTLNHGTTAWHCFQPSREIPHYHTSHRTTSLPCPAGRRRGGDAECSLQSCWVELSEPEGKWPLLHPWASLHRHLAVQGLTKAEIKSRLSA